MVKARCGIIICAEGETESGVSAAGSGVSALVMDAERAIPRGERCGGGILKGLLASI